MTGILTLPAGPFLAPRALLSGAAAVMAATLAMAATPASGTANIQRVVSPGGVEAWLVEERAIPIISIDVAFRGGATRDPEGQGGLARLFAGMLTQGAGDLDAAEFAEAADAVAARLGFSAGRDTVTGSISMLAERRNESLALFRSALTEPRFDADALERAKARAISGLRQAETNPQRLASRAWFAAKFPNDVYGRPTAGSIDSVTALTPDALRAAMPTLLNRSQMVVGVVGAISAAELAPILDDLFAGLADSPLPPLPPVEAVAASGVEITPFDAPQSTVVFGHAGLLRSDPDFVAASVMNYVLGGGGFSSRLTEEIREERGLAYGVYSYLAPLDRAGLYLGGVGTDNARVSETIALVKQEWARMAENGVTEDELERAKRYLTGSYPLRFDSNGKIAGFLVAAQLDGLGIDYIDRRNALVEAVTVEDIRRVAARLLKPEGLFFSVVGQPAGL